MKCKLSLRAHSFKDNSTKRLPRFPPLPLLLHLLSTPTLIHLPLLSLLSHLFLPLSHLYPILIPSCLSTSFSHPFTPATVHLWDNTLVCTLNVWMYHMICFGVEMYVCMFYEIFFIVQNVCLYELCNMLWCARYVFVCSMKYALVCFHELTNTFAWAF